MAEKKETTEIGFDEALRRIGHTPKNVVSDKELIISKDVGYNAAKEATRKPPPPAKRRP